MAAIGQSAPGMYFLICERADIEAVQADIAAEVGVQFGTEVRLLDASLPSLDHLLEASYRNDASRTTLFTFRHWEHKLVNSLDRNIVLIAQRGPVLFLAALEVAERTLAAAPNLRNRLADVLFIKPDEVLGHAVA